MGDASMYEDDEKESNVGALQRKHYVHYRTLFNNLIQRGAPNKALFVNYYCYNSVLEDNISYEQIDEARLSCIVPEKRQNYRTKIAQLIKLHDDGNKRHHARVWIDLEEHRYDERKYYFTLMLKRFNDIDNNKLDQVLEGCHKIQTNYEDAAKKKDLNALKRKYIFYSIYKV